MFAALLLAAAPGADAGDAAAGWAKARYCARCHGHMGISHGPQWPNLARQREAYLIKQLVAFRSGERPDPIMGPIASQLSDADIQDLAAYYSGQGSAASGCQGRGPYGGRHSGHHPNCR